MNNKQIGYIAGRALTLLMVLPLISGVFFRCAAPMKPMGGPKDSLPPLMVSANPATGATNFSGKTINIRFDEYIQLKDQQKEFFISPFIEQKPTLMVKQKSVVATFKEALGPDQTYSLNFGQSIVDNNEGNPLTGFRYVFSTGSAIDSMLLTAYTVDAAANDSIGGVFVLFYDNTLAFDPQNDSTVFNLKPSAVSRSLPNGVVIAENLKPIDYRIYAFEDKNSNQKYEPGAERIAFMDGTYNPAKMEDMIGIWYDTIRNYFQADPQMQLRLFNEVPKKQQRYVSSARLDQGKINLTFAAPNPEIISLELDGVEPSFILREYLKPTKDSMFLWLDTPQDLPDTLLGNMIYIGADSIGNPIPDTVKLRLVWKEPVVEGGTSTRTRNRATQGDIMAVDSLVTPIEVAGNDSIINNLSDYKTPELLPQSEEPKVKTKQELRKEKKLKKREAKLKKRELRRNRRQKAAAKRAESRAEKQGADSTAYVNPFKYKVEPVSEINPEKMLTLSFDYPIMSMDTAAITLTKTVATSSGSATTPKPVVVPFSISRDSVKIREWAIDAKWEQGMNYNLLITPNALVNTMAESNDTISVSLKAMKETDFATATIIVKPKTPDSRYILRLTTESNAIIEERKDIKEGSYIFKFIPGGNVKIIVIEDNNANGLWDEGSLIKRIQPERIAAYTTDGKTYNLVMKKGWKHEDITLNMNELFAPVTVESLKAILEARQERYYDAEMKRREIMREEDKKNRNNQSNSSGSGMGSMSSGMRNAASGNMGSMGR